MHVTEPAGPPDEASWADGVLARLRSWARELGFSQIGVAGVDLASAEPGLAAWLAAGFHGEMDYMARHGLKRARPAELVPGTVSVITARMDYLPRATQAGWQDIEWQGLEAAGQGRVSMYARGMSTREITGHLRELYGIDVSPDLISTVTDAVLEEVAAWQARPLDPAYPLVFFDAIRVKIRDEGMVRNKAIHIALGVLADGTKVVLGLWIEQNEGAKFWLRVMNELKNRGVEDIMLAVVDGLKGFPDAITAVFPEAIVQTCIVHLLRNSMDFVSWKDRKPLASALKSIYRAVDAKAAEEALTAFENSEWGRRYPAIGQSWRRAWSEVIPFFAFPDEVRRIVYTTNAIEALNAQLRRAVRARGHFPSDDAATKLLYLILNRSEKTWKMPPREWSMAKAQFAVLFGERFIKAMAA